MYMFMQNVIKLSAAVHELSTAHRERKTGTKTIRSVATARTIINKYFKRKKDVPGSS